MIHIWTYTIRNWEYRIDLGTDGRYYVQETNREAGSFEQNSKSFPTETAALHWCLTKLEQHSKD